MKRLNLIAALLIVAVGTLAVVLGAHVPNSDWTELFVVALMYGSVNLVPLTLPRGDSLQASCGVAVASVLLLSPQAAVLGAIGGVLLSALTAKSLHRSLAPVLLDIARVPLMVAAVGFVYSGMGFGGALAAPSPEFFLAAVAAAGGYVFLDLVTYGALWALAEKHQVLHSVTALIRLVGGMYIGQASVGIVLAVVLSPMGAVGVLVLVSLMMVMKFAFALLIQIRTAYTKTVGVLATLAETAHMETRGHSERVAELATAMGRCMHLRQSQLKRLGLAALLHDIGAVGVGGNGTSGEHAHVGAQIVKGVDFLEDVAPIVEAHHDDFVRGGVGQQDTALLAQALRVASDYDLKGPVDDEAPAAALEGIRLHSGDKYDPAVVAALGKSISRRSSSVGSS